MNAYTATHPRWPWATLRIVTYFQASMHRWKLVVQAPGVPEDPLIVGWGSDSDVLEYLSTAQREGWQLEPEALCAAK